MLRNCVRATPQSVTKRKAMPSNNLLIKCEKENETHVLSVGFALIEYEFISILCRVKGWKSTNFLRKNCEKNDDLCRMHIFFKQKPKHLGEKNMKNWVFDQNKRLHKEM